MDLKLASIFILKLVFDLQTEGEKIYAEKVKKLLNGQLAARDILSFLEKNRYLASHRDSPAPSYPELGKNRLFILTDKGKEAVRQLCLDRLTLGIADYELLGGLGRFSMTALRILNTILLAEHSEQRYAGAIAQQLGIGGPLVSNTLKILEKDNWVVARKNKGDKRIYYSLTSKAEAACTLLNPLLSAL